MLGRSDQPALHRIVVQILQLLWHHLISHDRLRIHSSLPDLVLALGFVLRTVVGELIEGPVAPFPRQLREDLAVSELLQVAAALAYLRAGYDGMEMSV